jgi:uncharacterized damage-inducible protein DinB
MADQADFVITPKDFFEHWAGHRRLTRRVIEAFPEDKLFTFSVGGMRPFGVLALEFLTMAEPTLRGIMTGSWDSDMSRDPMPKAELLRRWDESTKQIAEMTSKFDPASFYKTYKAFGQWEGPGHWLLFYVVDNEIHHRGQGYVYLRALGIEPPHFWER